MLGDRGWVGDAARCRLVVQIFIAGVVILAAVVCLIVFVGGCTLATVGAGI